jgi:hypothetical protein
MAVWTEADLAAKGYVVHPETTARVTEDHFLRRLRTLAKGLGFLTYHTHDSRRSEPGFPDLILAKTGARGKPGRLLMVELKTNTGKLSKDQQTWLSILAHTVPGIEVYAWRPRDWAQIVSILTTHP